MTMRAFRRKELNLLAALAIIAGAVLGSGANERAPAGNAPLRGTLAAVADEFPRGTAAAEIEPVEEATVRILVYHHVTPDVAGPPATRPYVVTPEEFRAEMTLISELGYRTVTMGDVIDAFEGVGALPEKPIVLTFDDGRENQYLHAFPVLREFGFIGTVFPFTNAIGRPDYLTEAQLREFMDAGFEIGSHTRYHPYLTKEADDDLEDELVLSKRMLEGTFGIEVRSIAWPFGLVDARVIAAAEEAGYLAGRGLSHGSVQRAAERMDLRAYIATGSAEALRRILSD